MSVAIVLTIIGVLGSAFVASETILQGRATILYLLLSLTAVSLVFAGVTFSLSDRLVVSPLRRLSAHVSNIVASGDFSARAPIRKANDEVSGLAGKINVMLQAVDWAEL
jgi:HAMP domain-containing protein